MTAFNPKHSRSSPITAASSAAVFPNLTNSTSDRTSSGPDPRLELAQQLAEKERKLQDSHSGIEKNVLVRQISQLQDKLAQGAPQDSDQQRISPAAVDRLSSLERDLGAYRTGRQRKESPSAFRDQLPSPTSSTMPPPAHGESTSLLPLPPPPTGSTPTRRRSKVPTNDHKNTDIEFATEIGQGLLLEVRKMQALLQEKEEQLRALEIQKADLERTAESLTKQVRQKEEFEERLKEESWNLELKNQELTTSITELQQNLSKANLEQNKLAKQVNDLTADIERLRDREEKTSATLDAMKQRHEQDMSAMRRHGAGLQREKAEQAKHIEALASELAIAKAQTKIAKRSLSEPDTVASSADEINNQETEASASGKLKKEGSTSGTTTPPSPQQTPARNQAMEVETLKTSLAHAHRMVSNLRSALHREKTDKFEFKKLLADSQETIEQLQNDPRLWVDAAGQGNRSTSTANNEPSASTSSRKSRKGRARTTPARKGRLARAHKEGDEEKLDETARRKRKDSQHMLDDSVYSYSSFNSEDESGFSEESDHDHDHIDGPGNDGFTSLSSELQQLQPPPPTIRKPIVVDVEVNTDPFDQVIAEELAKAKAAAYTGVDMAVDPISEAGSVKGGDTEATLSASHLPDKHWKVHVLPSVAIAPESPTSPNIEALAVHEVPDETDDARLTPADDETRAAPGNTDLQASEATRDRVRSNETDDTLHEALGNDTPEPRAAAMTDEALLQHVCSGTDVGVQASLGDTAPVSSVASLLASGASALGLGALAAKAVGKRSSVADPVPPTQDTETVKTIADKNALPSNDTTGTGPSGGATATSYADKIEISRSTDESVSDETRDHLPQESTQNPAATSAAGGVPEQSDTNTPSTAEAADKVYSKSEVDAMVAAAVATATAQLQPPQDITDDKRHTCDMSTNAVSTAGNGSPPAQLNLADLASGNTHRSSNSSIRASLGIPPRPTSPPPVALLSRATSNTPPTATLNGHIPLNRNNKPTSRVSLSAHSDSPSVFHRSAVTPRESLYRGSRDEMHTSPSLSSFGDELHTVPSSSLNSQSESNAIPLITEVMIGDWLWKYTRRRPVGHSNRHQRYFWIHPYTRTLYWSTEAPGVESHAPKTKSAYIKRVTTVPNQSGPPNAPNVSILFETNGHPIKVTAPSMKRHQVWMESLNWLLSRPDTGSSLNVIREKTGDDASMGMKRSVSSGRLSLFKKAPSMAGLAMSKKHKSLPSVAALAHKEKDDDDHFDDHEMEDVRMCCNGKHHVSKLERERVHRPKYRKRTSRAV